MRAKCAFCENLINKGTIVCRSCVQTKKGRDALDIRTAADYSLSKSDYLLNALCFLHACGQLEDVMDKIESHVYEKMMASDIDVKTNPDDIIDELTLSEYNYAPRYPVGATMFKRGKS